MKDRSKNLIPNNSCSSNWRSALSPVRVELSTWTSTTSASPPISSTGWPSPWWLCLPWPFLWLCGTSPRANMSALERTRSTKLQDGRFPRHHQEISLQRPITNSVYFVALVSNWFHALFIYSTHTSNLLQSGTVVWRRALNRFRFDSRAHWVKSE